MTTHRPPPHASSASRGGPGRGGRRAWWGLTAAGVLGSVALWWLPADWAAALDWQPARAASEPWRWFTAALVHLSGQHLVANVVAALVVGAFGAAAAGGRRAALAWALAWPLAQLGLLLRPEVAHYGGLSGVLHAGVAVAVVGLLLQRRGRARRLAAAVGAGLCIKLLLERPWGPAVQQTDGWDIAIVPWSHLSGAVAGALTMSMMAAAGLFERSAARASPDTDPNSAAPIRGDEP